MTRRGILLPEDFLSDQPPQGVVVKEIKISGFKESSERVKMVSTGRYTADVKLIYCVLATPSRNLHLVDLRPPEHPSVHWVPH